MAEADSVTVELLAHVIGVVRELVYGGVVGHTLLMAELQIPAALELSELTKTLDRPPVSVDTVEFVALFTVTAPVLLLKMRTCHPTGIVVASGRVRV